MPVSVKVLLFASAREAAGNVSEVTLSLDDGSDTSTFRIVMAEKYPKLSSMVMDEESLTLALNEEYVQTGDVISLKNGDTVALIPPISGG
eukprot:CAMPEP_0204630084 /NCGR_PEP_ID=MMETSP0717-20131115/19558_1 /ASSEMBLY_ACC=CAM_ASM_000666 /TAXON_ID=230516 /ORGANISM="Chaetoceros curvisetus" /LENGTH=89 /DNA_ID=CAMNT_0051647215 /DNA_START=29 /DNA_END=298 /DNA_ORIENTATION=+